MRRLILGVAMLAVVAGCAGAPSKPSTRPMSETRFGQLVDLRVPMYAPAPEPVVDAAARQVCHYLIPNEKSSWETALGLAEGNGMTGHQAVEWVSLSVARFCPAKAPS